MKRTSIIIYLKFNNLSLTNLHFFRLNEQTRTNCNDAKSHGVSSNRSKLRSERG